MRKWILIVIALQVIALAFIAGKREWIYHFGEVVYLKTAPVDPRDIFRGDYVQLRYDIAAKNNLIPHPPLNELSKNQPLYMRLNKDKNGIANARAISTQPPKEGLFIKGYHDYRKNIRFGIEKYFIEQGTGKSIEDKRGTRDSWQTAMEVEVALGTDGTAVIKGYRWSKISIELKALAMSEEESNASQTNPRTPINPRFSLSFKNTSTDDIILLDNDQHCSFTLFNLQTNKTMVWANKKCADKVLEKIILKTDDVYQFSIDFAKPQWQVMSLTETIKTAKAVTLVDLERNRTGFRLIYQAPIDDLKKDDSVYASYLKTTRFRVSGRVD